MINHLKKLKPNIKLILLTPPALGDYKYKLECNVLYMYIIIGVLFW